MRVDQVICQCRLLPRVGRSELKDLRTLCTSNPFRPRRSRLAQATDAQRRSIRSRFRPEYAVGIEHVGGSKCSQVHIRLPDVPYHPLVSGHYSFPSRAVQVPAPTPAVWADSSSHRRPTLPSPTTTEDSCPSTLFNASGHAQRAIIKRCPSQGTSCFAVGSGDSMMAICTYISVRIFDTNRCRGWPCVIGLVVRPPVPGYIAHGTCLVHRSRRLPPGASCASELEPYLAH